MATRLLLGISQLLLVIVLTKGQDLQPVLLCENTGQLPLTCPGNTLIRIQSAFWGRDDYNTTCPHPSAVGMDSCSLDPDTSRDVLRHLCEGQSRCDIDARVEYFGDPCPGNYKYLRVQYTCEECVNIHPDDGLCEFWRLYGQCENDREWMQENCRKACWDVCDVTEPPCEDLHQERVDCPFWAALGECVNNDAWMIVNCRRSCLNCDSSTDCSVDRHDAVQGQADCLGWYDEGECGRNPGYMLPMCTKSCFECNDNDVIRCTNKYDDEVAAAIAAAAAAANPTDGAGDAMEDFEGFCGGWAGEGQCDINSGFMFPLCLQSCTNCTADPDCVNVLPDGECVQRQLNNECVTDAVNMYTNCWKTCTGCQGAPECTNKHGNDVECDLWGMLGECQSNTAYMMENCTLSCTRCGKSAQQRRECENLWPLDEDCNDWAVAGECHNNPDWMFSYCRRSCSLCDIRDTLKLLGPAPTPGPTNSFTRQKTILLPDSFTVSARVTHFVAYFASVQPVYLQIWQRASSNFFLLKYSHLVTPDTADGLQTVLIDGCVTAEAGDRIGFTNLMPSPSPLAMTFDIDNIRKSTSYRSPASKGSFINMRYPYRFALVAGYDDVNLCPQ